MQIKICGITNSNDALACAAAGVDLIGLNFYERSPRYIGPDQARTIALKTISGEITDEELETEEGGSGLRYTFDIKRGNDTYEVGIDAKTGGVLENTLEGNRH